MDYEAGGDCGVATAAVAGCAGVVMGRRRYLRSILLWCGGHGGGRVADWYGVLSWNVNVSQLVKNSFLG